MASFPLRRIFESLNAKRVTWLHKSGKLQIWRGDDVPRYLSFYLIYAISEIIGRIFFFICVGYICYALDLQAEAFQKVFGFLLFMEP